MGWWRAAVAQVKSMMGVSARPGAAATFSTSGPIDALLRGAWANGWMSAGPVSRDEAMSVGAVERGRDVLCSIATLPLVNFRGLEVVPNYFLDQPDPDVPRVVHLAQTIEDLLCEGIAWWVITGKDYRGFPTTARRVEPGVVSLTPPTGDTRSPAPLPSGLDPRRASVWVDGIEIPTSWVIRFDSPGRPLLSTGHRTIRRALLLDALAAMYAENPRPLEAFTDTDDQTVVPFTDPQVELFLAQYMMGRRRGGPAYIPRQMQRSDVSAPSPSELQLVELQREVSLELALHMGLDPEDVGVNTTSRTYFNAQDRRTDKINHTFGPYMAAITDRLSMGDVTPRGQGVRWDLTEYLRPDPASQITYWQGLKGMGIVSDDWIARQAGVGAADRAAATARPAAAAPALSATMAPALVAARAPLALPAGPDYRITGNPNPTMAGAGTFAGEPAGGMRFSVSDFAGAKPSATADTAKRTITGLAVPFGARAEKFGVGFRFRPGALEYDAAALNRLRVMDGHATYVGVHKAVDMTKAGPVVTLHILDGPEGSPTKHHRDQLLYDAAGGLADGLSVGVDFSLDPADGDVEWSEADSTYDVVRATWLETSVTPDPAFTGARVTKVAASKTGGTMQCTFCGHAHPQGMACATWQQLNPQLGQQQQNAAAFSLVPQQQQQAPQQQQTQQLVGAGAGGPALQQFAQQLPQGPVSAEQLSAALSTAVQNMISNGQIAAAPPAAAATLDPTTGQFATPVNPGVMALPGAAPTGHGTQTFGPARVTEPEPYRLVFNRRSGEYDLRPASHDFSRDLIAHLKDGDKAAGDRAHDFARRNFNVATTDVDELNPTRQRPDMWVDQRDYETPVWNTVYKGALTDITPFAFPKYSSSSALVAAHTEGVEPTTGTYVVTNQTVSPTPYSGKARINREVWDQGGNPQVSSIIWNQMVRGAREAWEALVITTLNAGSFTALATLTAGAVDRAVAGRVLGNEIENGIALLQFARGGMRFRAAFAQADLYMGLKGATDTAGAPLYPIIGPANRNGTAATLFGEIDMGGIPFLPAWALAAVGQTAAAKSYLVDPTSVHAWSSAPSRLTLDGIAVAYVDLGIWGYQAAAVSDTAGVRTITWDPVA